jgi:hypothetical protein
VQFIGLYRIQTFKLDPNFYNETFTELGALLEVNDGFLCIFAGEPDANGRALNSSRVGKGNTDPRNIGFIKFRKDFDKLVTSNTG